MAPNYSFHYVSQIATAAVAFLLTAITAPAQQTGSSPVKIFILAGQSNMEGHGEMTPIGTRGTLEYLVDTDPATYEHLQDGANWADRDDVWISYKRGGTTLLNGNLAAGWGVRADTIGPELQFGNELGDYLEEQVLIIKTAWGGKSLYTDFRPPSSGWSVNPPVAPGDQGYYYQQMLNDIDAVIANLSTYFPDYNVGGEYEFAGFGWHQGWNDRVNSAAVTEYEANMENFIKDVRSDLSAIYPSAANLPFVIATTGIGGWDETGTNALALMDAQLAMEDFVTYPAFDGNVAVVDTRDFWRDAPESPSITQGYHWNRNAESYYLIGQSMATHMRVLLDGGDTTPPAPDPMTWATPPSAAGEGEITMTASTATDIIGVEYFFECTTGGGNDSGWQDSPAYTDTGLSNSTNYSYQVKARDKSPDANETGWSPLVAATTTPADATAPTPSPMTWAAAPDALSSRAITMTASTASDPSGVEYYFANTTISGHDSGWQDSPEYTDTGLAPSTSYTYEVTARDKSVAANQTVASPPTAAMTLDPPAPGALIYEPFDDPDPSLSGNTPGLGLTGTWNSGGATVTPGSLSYGGLATQGNHALKTGSSGYQNSSVDPGTTLSLSGLLYDSAELWFSALAVSVSDSRTYIALGNGNADGFDRIGPHTGGKGFAIKLNNGTVKAHGWAGPGAIGGASPAIADGTHLVVGKITWGAPGFDDTLEVFLPGTDLALPATAASTLTWDFDQSAFNTISFAGGTNMVPEIDEIRFGATYADVTPATDDTTAPVPSPLTWNSVPAAIGQDQITMTASTATDPSGVEYYFEETTDNPGGDDSGWQDSPSYTDAGLNPSTTYSYQVKARDKSINSNETTSSSLESATTTATDTTAPTPDPMTWAVAPTAVSSTSITMTADIASDPSGVEYYFTNTTIGGHDSGWQDSPTYTDIGLNPSTTHAYQVKARDQSPAANETALSTPPSATTTQGIPTSSLIYEPFDDADPTLAGNTPGAGLIGTWSAGAIGVTSGSLSYGSLASSGNHALATSNRFKNAFADPGTTLSGAGLLADGAELWFSALVTSVPDSRTYIALGTGNADGFDRIGGTGGSGVGIRLENGSAYAHGWDNTSAVKPAGTAVSDGTVLIVGKITWAASGSNDTVELFLPGTDLALPGSASSTMTRDFDQSAFDTISFAGGNRSDIPEVDEIRFGATYAEVVPTGGSDYDDWAENHPGADLSDPDADLDGDGLTNDEERIWGLDPNDGASLNPISVPLNANGAFTYTRRDPSLSGLTYSVWTSPNLQPGSWVEDTSASQIPGTPDANDVETVAVTLTAIPVAGKLFVRIEVNE